MIIAFQWALAAKDVSTIISSHITGILKRCVTGTELEKDAFIAIDTFTESVLKDKSTISQFSSLII